MTYKRARSTITVYQAPELPIFWEGNQNKGPLPSIFQTRLGRILGIFHKWMKNSHFIGHN